MWCNTERSKLPLSRRSFTAAVFGDLGKVPDKSDVLTIFRTSVSREAKTVLKKLVAKVSKQNVDEFRFLSISSRVLALMRLNVDKLTKLLPCGCSAGRGSVFGINVLIDNLTVFKIQNEHM